MALKMVLSAMSLKTSNHLRILSRSLPPIRLTVTRPHATQTSVGTSAAPDRPRHRTVTVFNDDGQVRWGDLSPAEKVARTTQQTFNFGLVGVGAAATVAVFLLIYTDVFSGDSSVSYYNAAVDRVRTDERCTKLLGEGKDISALLSPTGTSWIRQRPRPMLETDQYGTEHMYLNFPVTGSLNKGTVRMHVLRRQDEKHFNYGTLVLDVAGHSQVYLENGDEKGKGKKQTAKSFLGFKL